MTLIKGNPEVGFTGVQNVCNSDRVLQKRRTETGNSLALLGSESELQSADCRTSEFDLSLEGRGCAQPDATDIKVGT